MGGVRSLGASTGVFAAVDEEHGSVNVGAVRVEQEGDGMGDLAGLRGLFLTDLRQTGLETALHLAERVGPDARRAHRPPRQASRSALHHSGVEICLVART